MNLKTASCVDSYRRHKNLKIVSAELGIPWQTVYVHLKNANEPVTGDKKRYGSATDRLSARAESIFKKLVPIAEDQNSSKYQAKVDFIVNGYTVDIKASRFRNNRWAFSIKKQEAIADFFVCFAFLEIANVKTLLIPGEICRHYSTISLAACENAKWASFSINPNEIENFFKTLPSKELCK